MALERPAWAGLARSGLTMDTLLRARSVATYDAWARALRAFLRFAASGGSSCSGRPLRLSPELVAEFALSLRVMGRAAATAEATWGALLSALRFLGVTVDSSVATDLLRRGLRASRPAPAPRPAGVPVSRLLDAALRMPLSTPVQRRDRLLVLLALLLGARPVDLTRVVRDDPRYFLVDTSFLRLRLSRDKSSQLAAKAASRWLHLPSDAPFGLRGALAAVLRDAPRERVHALPASGLHVVAPLFVCLDGRRFGEPLSVDSVSFILRRFLAYSVPTALTLEARHIRAISASSAYELGVPLDEVCRHFRWQSAATFLDHYQRWNVETRLPSLPEGPQDGSRVGLAFAAALHRFRSLHT